MSGKNNKIMNTYDVHETLYQNYKKKIITVGQQLSLYNGANMA